jgi:Prolyl oligopeptidase family
MMKRALLKWFLGTLLFLSLLVCLLILFFSFKDHSHYFRSIRGTQTSISIQQYACDARTQKSWLTINADNGFNVQAGLLAPRDSSMRYPAIILLGGKATGKYAVNYALDIDNVVILALDYPYEPRESYTFWTILWDVPRVRKALLDMVPSAILAADYLFSRHDVDTTRLVILGYSFGAPFVPAIVAHDRRAAAAIMVYGGGELTSMIRHNVARYESAWLSEFVGRLGGVLLHPLEPMTYADKISPTPLVMINGANDEQIPRYNTELFFHVAREPKKLIWLQSQHVRPDNEELTRRIISTLKEELKRLKIL